MSSEAHETFRAACGATRPLILEVRHDATPGVVRREFAQPFVRVGTDARNDLVLSDPKAGARHAYLQVVDGQVFCVDLDSDTGTSSEAGWEQKGWIMPGQSFRIGSHTIRLVEPLSDGLAAAEELASPLGALGSGAAGLPDISLDFQDSAHQITQYHMKRVLTLVGRSRICKVQLASPGVSRIHCSLLRTPHGLWLIDLFGRGGVQVNEVHVEVARLQNGDRLKIGTFQVRVRIESPRGRPEAGEDIHDSPPLASADGSPSVVLSALLAALPPGAANGPALSLGGPATNGSAAGQVGSDAGLMALVGHFNTMQQQMFEHFRQTMLAVVQTFGHLYQEQMAAVRQELDRLHELTRDLTRLQAELLRHSARPRSEPAVVTPPPRQGPRIGLRRSVSPPQKTENGQAEASEVRDVIDDTEIYATAGSRVDAAAPDDGPPSNGVGEQLRVDELLRETEVAGLGASGASPTPAAKTTDEIHAWLQARITQIQEERQGVWQRILQTLSGRRPGDAR
jgi:pSer/pThr/pTyr-binding forkhead associated (FHA) protein